MPDFTISSTSAAFHSVSVGLNYGEKPGKKLARGAGEFTPTGVKMRRWLGVVLGALGASAAGRAQAPEIDLPRPGIVIVAEVTGDVAMTTGDQKRKLKPDDRVRIGATVTTARRSMATLNLSNGIAVQLGSDSEIEIEEFGQAPFSSTTKVPDLKAEPSLSRTRIKLVRGDVLVTVKKLQASRGSTFGLATPAGNLRTAEGTFRARVQMHDLGLGVAMLELQTGAAEFEVLGSTGYAPVPLGRKVAFALEVDKNGVVKVGEMPKETPKGK